MFNFPSWRVPERYCNDAYEDVLYVWETRHLPYVLFLFLSVPFCSPWSSYRYAICLFSNRPKSLNSKINYSLFTISHEWRFIVNSPTVWKSKLVWNPFQHIYDISLNHPVTFFSSDKNKGAAVDLCFLLCRGRSTHHRGPYRGQVMCYWLPRTDCIV